MGVVASVAKLGKCGQNGQSLGRLFVMTVVVLMAGCDQLGIDTPAKIEERIAAESKAIGGACRHAMRAIEDCYAMNPKAQKAAIAGGWREMDEYMRENKLEGVTPTIARSLPGRATNSKNSEEDDGAEEDTTATAGENAASKSQADAGHAVDQDKAAKTDNGKKSSDNTEKAAKEERGAGSKVQRDKRDTLHAEASGTQPH